MIRGRSGLSGATLLIASYFSFFIIISLGFWRMQQRGEGKKATEARVKEINKYLYMNRGRKAVGDITLIQQSCMFRNKDFMKYIKKAMTLVKSPWTIMVAGNSARDHLPLPFLEFCSERERSGYEGRPLVEEVLSRKYITKGLREKERDHLFLRLSERNIKY